MTIDQFMEEHKRFIEAIDLMFLGFRPLEELKASWEYCIWEGCETVPFDQIEVTYNIKLKDMLPLLDYDKPDDYLPDSQQDELEGVENPKTQQATQS